MTGLWFPIYAEIVQVDQSNIDWSRSGHGVIFTGVGPVGLEPTTHGLKVRCSTD